MPKAWIVGNWKMNLSPSESSRLASDLKKMIPTKLLSEIDVSVCPGFAALAAVQQVLSGSGIAWGAQNVFWEPKGAYTGEVSARDLSEFGCRYTLVGHSERRQYFHETDATVAKKQKSLLAAGIHPIVCIGETQDERDRGDTETVVLRQLTHGLDGLRADDASRVVVAYEPVWAIGTGRTAHPEEAQAVHTVIRRTLAEMVGPVGEQIPILYGGSATPETIGELIQYPDISGFLVGGASLKAESFVKMIEIVAEIRQ